MDEKIAEEANRAFRLERWALEPDCVSEIAAWGSNLVKEARAESEARVRGLEGQLEEKIITVKGMEACINSHGSSMDKVRKRAAQAEDKLEEAQRELAAAKDDLSRAFRVAENAKTQEREAVRIGCENITHAAEPKPWWYDRDKEDGPIIYTAPDDPERTCPHCNRTFRVDPMDASCRFCGKFYRDRVEPSRRG